LTKFFFSPSPEILTGNRSLCPLFGKFALALSWFYINDL